MFKRITAFVLVIMMCLTNVTPSCEFSAALTGVTLVRHIIITSTNAVILLNNVIFMLLPHESYHDLNKHSPYYIVISTHTLSFSENATKLCFCITPSTVMLSTPVRLMVKTYSVPFLSIIHSASFQSSGIAGVT